MMMSLCHGDCLSFEIGSDSFYGKFEVTVTFLFEESKIGLGAFSFSFNC